MEAGGPVSAGTPYIVGEKRPEIFVPDVAGRILPNTHDLLTSVKRMGSKFGGYPRKRRGRDARLRLHDRRAEFGSLRSKRSGAVELVVRAFRYAGALDDDPHAYSRRPGRRLVPEKSDSDHGGRACAARARELEEIIHVFEVEFPRTISYHAVGGPVFSTQVNEGFSGQEQRNRNWAFSRGKWTVSLITPQSFAGNRQAFIDLVNGFFLNVGGKADAFRLKDHKDFIATNQALATVNANVQLVKQYAVGGRTYTRVIFSSITLRGRATTRATPSQTPFFYTGRRRRSQWTRQPGSSRDSRPARMVDFQFPRSGALRHGRASDRSVEEIEY